MTQSFLVQNQGPVSLLKKKKIPVSKVIVAEKQ